MDSVSGTGIGGLAYFYVYEYIHDNCFVLLMLLIVQNVLIDCIKRDEK